MLINEFRFIIYEDQEDEDGTEETPTKSVEDQGFYILHTVAFPGAVDMFFTCFHYLLSS